MTREEQWADIQAAGRAEGRSALEVARLVHTYRVTWEIDVEASSPQEAARQARHHQTKPDTTATVFDVHREGVEPVRVDLTELEER